MALNPILILFLLPRIWRKTINNLISQSPDIIEDPTRLTSFLKQKFSNGVLSDISDKTNHIVEQSNLQNIKIITLLDPDFPEDLKSIPDPPVLLFYRGNINLLTSQKRIAIVGTRTPSKYGIQTGTDLTKWFVNQGYVIISGLAVGCDTVAHQTCISIGGKTIAWLPTGVDKIYPTVNQPLSEKIIEHGSLLISEYPIGTGPHKGHFIERDRLQSGSSQGVIVLETEIDGGTMHTVNFAIQQGRKVGCLSYSYNLDIPQIQGNRWLIESGKAKPVDPDNLSEFEGWITS